MRSGEIKRRWAGLVLGYDDRLMLATGARYWRGAGVPARPGVTSVWSGGTYEAMKLYQESNKTNYSVTTARCRAQVSRHRVWHVTPPSWKSVTIVFTWSHVVQVLYQMSPLFTILQGYQSSPNIFSMANRNVRNVTIVDIWYTFNLFGVHSKFSNIVQQKPWIWWKSKKFNLGNYLQSLFQN